MKREVRKIATASRREMEHFVGQFVEDKYNKDNLGCYCGISSYFLCMVGRKFGYHFTLVEGLAFDSRLTDNCGEENIDPFDSNHCWVEYEGLIIDLTATQFDSGLRKVHVTDVDDYDNYYAIRRGNAARRALKSGWTQSQSPYGYIKELKRRAKKLQLQLQLS